MVCYTAANRMLAMAQRRQARVGGRSDLAVRPYFGEIQLRESIGDPARGLQDKSEHRYEQCGETCDGDNCEQESVHVNRFGMECDHFINVKHYATRPSHKTTLHPPCARTRNRHDSSLYNIQPSSPGNRQIAFDPRTRARHEQRTSAVNATQNLRCMVDHAHGTVAV